MNCDMCGLLALKDEYSREVKEVESSTRTSRYYSASCGRPAKATVFCYAASPAFDNRCNQVNTVDSFQAIIKQERQCDGFYRKYHPGKSPQEHEEMTILEQVRFETKSAASEMERRQKLAEEKATKAEEIAETRADAADKRQQKTLLLSITALVVSVLMGVAGPLTVEYIKRSFWSSPDNPPTTKSEEEIRDFVRQELKTMTQYPPHPSQPPTAP